MDDVLSKINPNSISKSDEFNVDGAHASLLAASLLPVHSGLSFRLVWVVQARTSTLRSA
jgi:hypothetical protein